MNPKDYKLEFLGKTKECLNNNGVISNEFVSIFVVYANIDIHSITLQEEEVSEIKWCSKEELNKFIEDKVIIPHEKEYEILNNILN